MPKVTHGHSFSGRVTKTYGAWRRMRMRCYLPTATGYELYGGRGITVCERWREAFSNFLADMGECPVGLELDRIDSNGNYEPGNCRWATRQQQSDNRRITRWITVGNETKTIRQWADKFSLTYQLVLARLRAGETPEQALSRPAWIKGGDKCRNGHTYTPETTLIKRTGYRTCVICERRAGRDYYYRHKSAA